MLLIFSIAGAAALAVVAYSRLRARSPEAASAATRAVRELAAVVMICTRAVEGVVDALAPRQRPLRAFGGSDGLGRRLRRPHDGLVTASRGHLRAVQSRSTFGNDHLFRVAAKAVGEGMQDIRVEAVTPLAGPGHGQIAVRVGRLLVYCNDREALEGFGDAWRGADALADRAFGPVDPPRYRRGS